MQRRTWYATGIFGWITCILPLKLSFVNKKIPKNRQSARDDCARVIPGGMFEAAIYSIRRFEKQNG